MKKSLSSIASSLGLNPSDYPTVEISHLLTDSRSPFEPESTLFFALETKGGDGHHFIPDLYNKGVRYFVVSEAPVDIKQYRGAYFLNVKNTLAALQRVCTRQTGAPQRVVAVVGSRGKTSVKEWAYLLFSSLEKCSRSPRSYNSQIGVPLSLWGMEADAVSAFIEAGISRSGEMAPLAAMIQPDDVIITDIGSEHDDGFMSHEAKIDEKLSILDSPGVGLVVYPEDSAGVAGRVKEKDSAIRKVGWAIAGEADVRFDIVADTIEYSYGNLKGRFRIPFSEESDIRNLLSVAAYMLARGLRPEDLQASIMSLRHLDTRLAVCEGVNGCSVILDGFTSDLASLYPALDFMNRRAAGTLPLTLILGDFHLQAGELSRDVYVRLPDLLEIAGVKRIIGVGEEISRHASLFAPEAAFFRNVEDFKASLSTSDFSNEMIMVSGGGRPEFADVAENLEARTHETVLEVNLDAIVSNFNYFRRQVPEGTGIIAMVKASAYGAGSYEVARTMQEHGAAYLAVAVLDEGVDLRRRGITMPIMVMNPKVMNYRTMFEYRLEPEVYSIEMLSDVIREAKKCGVERYPLHIKLDTGMHRMGFVEDEIPAVIGLVKSSENVSVSSLFTHLATADCTDMDEYTLRQLHLFRRMTDTIRRELPYPVKRHALNSAGIVRFPEYAYEMVRLGIGLYGVNTLPPEMEEPLAVVSTLRTVIISIREWEAGESIGYGRKGILSRRSRIATIPVGYADGMNRHFGRGAVSVLVNGKEAPTVGNICMDACMIDVTDIDCSVGDSVEIFGRGIPVDRLSDLLGTIPYEILTSVSPRVKRVYYRE